MTGVQFTISHVNRKAKDALAKLASLLDRLNNLRDVPQPIKLIVEQDAIVSHK